jgi:toxin ParE1/3/4
LAYTFENWSLEQAESYVSEMIAACEGLAKGIKVGRPVDVRDGYLKYAVGSHVLFYRTTSRTIEIIRILHQRMDVNRHL